MSYQSLEWLDVWPRRKPSSRFGLIVRFMTCNLKLRNGFSQKEFLFGTLSPPDSTRRNYLLQFYKLNYIFCFQIEKSLHIPSSPFTRFIVTGLLFEFGLQLAGMESKLPKRHNVSFIFITKRLIACKWRRQRRMANTATDRRHHHQKLSNSIFIEFNFYRIQLTIHTFMNLKVCSRKRRMAMENSDVWEEIEDHLEILVIIPTRRK